MMPHMGVTPSRPGATKISGATQPAERREEMSAKRFCSSIELVAHHDHHFSLFLQRREELDDARIGFCRIDAVLSVMHPERGQGLVEERVLLPLWHGSLHEFPHSVSHEAPYVVDGMFRHAMRPQCIVGTCCEIAEGVEECPVEVEDVCVVGHRLFHALLLCAAMVLTLLL